MSAGSQLLRNTRIHFTAQDAAQLRAGEVDSRLLATLAALSSQYSFTRDRVRRCLPRRSGAVPGSDHRERRQQDGTAELAAALALVKAQEPPYLPAHAAIVHPAAGRAALSIEFAAPSPLGLLTAVLDVATRR